MGPAGANQQNLAWFWFWFFSVFCAAGCWLGARGAKDFF
jgi:hypothetical protein